VSNCTLPNRQYRSKVHVWVVELVATSRVEDLSCLAMGNKSDELSRQLFMKIGITEAYAARTAYLDLEDIKGRAATSRGEHCCSRSQSQPTVG